MLAKNFTAATRDLLDLRQLHRYHMDLVFQGPDEEPANRQGLRGFVRVRPAIWGDKTLTRDQLIEIGKQSIKQAGWFPAKRRAPHVGRALPKSLPSYAKGSLRRARTYPAPSRAGRLPRASMDPLGPELLARSRA